MNGFTNLDTFFVAGALDNIESLYHAARRITSTFALRNLVADAIEAGIIGDDIEIDEIDFEELLDHVTEYDESVIGAENLSQAALIEAAKEAELLNAD